MVVSVITLGCPKNTVDTEVLLRQVDANRIAYTVDPEKADVLVINTCGFIDDAKKESIETILAAVERKRQGKLRAVYVAGCLPMRYRQELRRELPEVDGFFGVTDFRRTIEALDGRYHPELLGERVLTTPPHTAYLKISEGCDHPCSYCTVPLIRGRYVSTPMARLVKQAHFLAERGVRELVIVAQDTTAYGRDLYGKRRLAKLLDQLAAIEGIRWLRLMYTNPAGFPLDVLDVMREHENICRYLDLPIQHISDPILRSMRRGITRRKIEELIDTIRNRLPGSAIRTSLIVGYPGETVKQFEELCSFVLERRFERLGVFTYSREEGTPAAALHGQVRNREKERRRAVLMELQAELSFERNRSFIGKTIPVLVDREEAGAFVGRTEHDAPEVDNEVLIPKRKTAPPLLRGSFVLVTITGADEYTLHGFPEP
ncbi:MAG: 30S ribosomal protein S12 methylthiotransferase RimO [Bacteroidota bacterium]|nr:30S ribosomal protein S12 methylthiotransferase RimO [Bacteroidota bacterium]